MGIEARGSRKPAPEAPEYRPMRALIVEDEAIVAVALTETLEDMGDETVAAVRNGYAAIALAEQYRPDFILMDVGLDGDMDGIEAARVIHDRFRIPIVFVTGNDNPLTELRVAAIDGAQMVHKPTNQIELDSAIRRAIALNH